MSETNRRGLGVGRILHMEFEPAEGGGIWMSEYVSRYSATPGWSGPFVAEAKAAEAEDLAEQNLLAPRDGTS